MPHAQDDPAAAEGAHPAPIVASLRIQLRDLGGDDIGFYLDVDPGTRTAWCELNTGLTPAAQVWAVTEVLRRIGWTGSPGLWVVPDTPATS